MSVNPTANLSGTSPSPCLSCLSAHHPVCPSVCLEETQLSRIILRHSNFPSRLLFRKTPKWLKRHECDPLTMTQARQQKKKKKKKTERDDIRYDTTLHFTSILSVLSPSGTYVLHFPLVWFCPLM